MIMVMKKNLKMYSIVLVFLSRALHTNEVIFDNKQEFMRVQYEF